MNRIVGQYLRFERSEQNEIYSKLMDLLHLIKKVKQNWNMLEPNRRNIPMILKLQT